MGENILKIFSVKRYALAPWQV